MEPIVSALKAYLGNAENTISNPGAAIQQATQNYQNNGIIAPVPANNTLIQPANMAYNKVLSSIQNGAYNAAHPINQAMNQAAQGLNPQSQSSVNAQTPNPAPSLDPVEQSTLPIFQQHGISPAVAYGIAQAEGGKIGQNNLWNINARDSDPNAANNYQNVQQAAQSAASVMANMLKKEGVTSKDPEKQLQAIEDAGYAGDPSTWQKRSASTGGAGKIYKHWSDFVKATGAYNKWAGN